MNTEDPFSLNILDEPVPNVKKSLSIWKDKISRCDRNCNRSTALYPHKYVLGPVTIKLMLLHACCIKVNPGLILSKDIYNSKGKVRLMVTGAYSYKYLDLGGLIPLA